eukprot:TRINITY_DN28981_c0_g1_i1.p1 TRINITY_DN28981_c0_g1~~TRINITY_DN28981_c0_g1_i1.p1  ORF type:complete len:661 (-),score=139.20 TRINITY_DN28981_c0_g1_i1:556-2475(-)
MARLAPDNEESVGSGDLCLPPVRCWEFPLTRAEKMQRLLQLFETELEIRDNDIEALREENSVLSSALAAAQASVQRGRPEEPVEAALTLANCGGGSCSLRGSADQVQVILERLGASATLPHHGDLGRRAEFRSRHSVTSAASSASSSPESTPPGSPRFPSVPSGGRCKKPILPGLPLGRLTGGVLAATPRLSSGSRLSMVSRRLSTGSRISCIGATPQMASTPRVFSIQTPPNRTPRVLSAAALSPGPHLGTVVTPRAMSRVWSLVTPRAPAGANSQRRGGDQRVEGAWTGTPRTPFAAPTFLNELKDSRLHESIDETLPTPLRRRSRQGALVTLAEDDVQRISMASSGKERENRHDELGNDVLDPDEPISDREHEDSGVQLTRGEASQHSLHLAGQPVPGSLQLLGSPGKRSIDDCSESFLWSAAYTGCLVWEEGDAEKEESLLAVHKSTQKTRLGARAADVALAWEEERRQMEIKQREHEEAAGLGIAASDCCPCTASHAALSETLVWPPTPEEKLLMVKHICKEFDLQLPSIEHMSESRAEEVHPPQRAESARTVGNVAESLRLGLVRAAERSKVAEFSSVLDAAGLAAEKARLGFNLVMTRAHAGAAAATAASEALTNRRQRHRRVRSLPRRWCR